MNTKTTATIIPAAPPAPTAPTAIARPRWRLPPAVPMARPTAPPPPPQAALLKGFGRLSCIVAVMAAIGALVSAEIESRITSGPERVNGWDMCFPYIIALLAGLAALVLVLSIGWIAARHGRLVFYGLFTGLALSLTATLLTSWHFPVQVGYLPGFIAGWGLVGFWLPGMLFQLCRWVAAGFQGG